LAHVGAAGTVSKKAGVCGLFCEPAKNNMRMGVIEKDQKENIKSNEKKGQGALNIRSAPILVPKEKKKKKWGKRLGGKKSRDMRKGLCSGSKKSKAQLTPRRPVRELEKLS